MSRNRDGKNFTFFGENALKELLGDFEPLPSPQRTNQPTSPNQRRAANPPQRRAYSGQGSLTPLTCADILNLPRDATSFTFKRYRASLVSLVGSVREWRPEGFILDDRTGWIQCSFASVDESGKIQSPRFSYGDYVQVIGEMKREILSKDFGDLETGGFLINVLHSERLLSINAIPNHMLQTTQAKLLYITADARHGEKFNA